MNEVTAIITQEQAKISCNFEQVKEAIQETLAEYKGAVFTEDSKTYAKKHVASLRSKKKDLQDNLREAKKEYMKPWDEFEGQAKELIALYDGPIDLINGQVQAFEEDRIAKKKELIEKIYGEMVPEELRGIIPENRIHNPKWENATFREKEIREEIAGIVTRTNRDIETIKSMDSEATEKALQVYRTSLDVMEAVTYIHNYDRQKQEIIEKEQERLRQAEEERVRREEREKVLAEQRAREEQEEAARRAEEEKAAAVERAKEEAAQEVIDSLIPDENGDTSLYEYRFALSADAKNKLEMYLDSVGIEWEIIS